MILFIIGLLASRQLASGLTCYVCQGTSSTSSCITDPDSTNQCDAAYCTIFRRQLQDPAGILTAFYRACEDSPTYLNTEVETPFAKTYYRACNTDLCNTGNGIETLTIESTISEDGDYIIVPGNGRSSSLSNLHPSVLWAVVLTIAAYAIVMYYG